MEKKTITDLVIIIILSTLLFSLPTIMRSDDSGIIGFPTYYHQRMAQTMLDNGTLPVYDELSFGGRPYLYPPAFHVTLALFVVIFGMFAGGVVMLALFGAAAVALAYLIVLEMFHDRKASCLVAFLAALMPATIFAFSHLCSRAPPIALGLASLYLLLREEKHPYISMALLGISALFHLETALVFAVVILPFLYEIYKKRGLKIAFPILVAVIIAGCYYVPFFIQNGFPEYNAIHNDYRTLSYSMQSAGTDEYFIELSPYASATIIAVLLALLGFLFANAKEHNYINYLRFWLIFIFILTMIFERFLIYMPVPLAIMAVLGASMLYNRLPRKMFAIVFIILIIWSVAGAAIKVNTMANEYPTSEQYSAMLWIKNNTEQNAVVVSDWSYGHWISGIAYRRNYMDGYAEYAPQANERHAQLQSLYQNFTIPSLLANETSIYLYAGRWNLERHHPAAEFAGVFSIAYEDDDILVMKLR